MQTADAVVGGGLAVVGQQAPDQVVVHAEAAQQRVAGGDLHHLGGGQGVDQGGGLFGDTQTEQGLFAVGADQALRQHQVGQVGFADFGEDLGRFHVAAPGGVGDAFVSRWNEL